MYCLSENEKISRMLTNIANWFADQPGYHDVSLKDLDRFSRLSKKIFECKEEFESIVESYWSRDTEKEEQTWLEKKEKEKAELLKLSKEELVKKLLINKK